MIITPLGLVCQQMKEVFLLWLHILTKKENLVLQVTTTKTESSNRILSIPSFVSDLLQEYYKATKYLSEKYIFSIHSSFRLNLCKKKYCRNAGVREVSPHALRHFHASFLIRQGVPINAISKRLGHSSPSMTLNIYSHCYRE